MEATLGLVSHSWKLLVQQSFLGMGVRYLAWGSYSGLGKLLWEATLETCIVLYLVMAAILEARGPEGPPKLLVYIYIQIDVGPCRFGPLHAMRVHFTALPLDQHRPRTVAPPCSNVGVTEPFGLDRDPCRFESPRVKPSLVLFFLRRR